MEKLILVSPELKHEKDVDEYVKEFIENGSEIFGSANIEKYMNNYTEWFKTIENGINYWNINGNKIATSTYFAYRKKDKKLIGTINIRHRLNDQLIIKDGYIGYSVRPTERRKGYAAEILKLGLLELKEKGINNVLITCEKDNIGSAKTILKNNGIIENEIFDEYSGKIFQRYWVNTDKINKN